MGERALSSAQLQHSPQPLDRHGYRVVVVLDRLGGRCMLFATRPQQNICMRNIRSVRELLCGGETRRSGAVTSGACGVGSGIAHLRKLHLLGIDVVGNGCLLMEVSISSHCWMGDFEREKLTRDYVGSGLHPIEPPSDWSFPPWFRQWWSHKLAGATAARWQLRDTREHWMGKSGRGG